MRLQKYLAQCGAASRRKCEELIAQGRVRVNGAVITQMGVQVEPGDTVTLDGKAVALHSVPVYTRSETSSIFSQ